MTIALRFSTTSDPISWAIRTRTMAPVSHVEFCDEHGWTLGARWTGVWLRPPRVNRHQRDIILATYPGIYNAYAWCSANRVGYKYDLLADLGIGFNADWHDRQRRMCSELMLESAEAVGVYLLNSRVERFQAWPGLLLCSPAITIIDGPPRLLRGLNATPAV